MQESATEAWSGKERRVIVGGVTTRVAGGVGDIHLATIRAVAMDITGIAFIIFIAGGGGGVLMETGRTDRRFSDSRVVGAVRARGLTVAVVFRLMGAASKGFFNG